MDTTDDLQQVLNHWNRSDIATLLERSAIDFDSSSTYGSYSFSILTTAEIHSPIKECEQLRKLSKSESDLLLRALLEVYPPKANSIEINKIEHIELFPRNLGRVLTNEELLRDVNAQQELMIDVSTGGSRINDVNEEYQTRRAKIGQALSNQGISDPVPYNDLWAWYAKWSNGDLPTYQSRRTYLTELFNLLVGRIRNKSASPLTIFNEPTGWTKVDRQLGEVRERLAAATNEEQFQAVGLLCREVLISLSQTVFNPDLHTTLDGVDPSDTDAKRQLEGHLSAELVGSSLAAHRRHARASLQLANDLQHDRTADFRDAALCAEATSSVVNLIAIISGQRDP